MQGQSYRRIFWCIIVISQAILFGYVIYKHIYSGGNVPPSPHNDTSWDTLLFVQSWPISYCSEWLEQAVKNKCDLPSNNNSWTIHGIWPTKTGTTGPTFCPLSVPFNRTVLQPIEKDLNASWPAIQYGEDPYQFWKHEWKKHGRCAYNVSYFNNELKYFSQGLTWLKQYNMRNILDEAGIIPSNNFNGTYNVSAYWNAIKNNIQKNPYIACYYDKAIKHHLISEVYICFDKQLNLIDCNVKVNVSKRANAIVLTNCPLKKPVLFLSVVPDKHNQTMSYVQS